MCVVRPTLHYYCFTTPCANLLCLMQLLCLCTQLHEHRAHQARHLDTLCVCTFTPCVSVTAQLSVVHNPCVCVRHLYTQCGDDVFYIETFLSLSRIIFYTSGSTIYIFYTSAVSYYMERMYDSFEGLYSGPSSRIFKQPHHHLSSIFTPSNAFVRFYMTHLFCAFYTRFYTSFYMTHLFCVCVHTCPPQYKLLKQWGLIRVETCHSTFCAFYMTTAAPTSLFVCVCL